MPFVPWRPGGAFQPSGRKPVARKFVAGLVPGPESAEVVEEEPVFTRADLERAAERGRQAGLAAGASRDAAFDAEIAGLKAVSRDLVAARRQAIRAADEDVAQLVLVLAKRIAGETLSLEPGALPGVIRRALERLPETDEARVRVSPQAAERITAALADDRAVRVIADPEIGLGCVVETRLASIDATMEAAIQGVDAAIQQWLESRP